jgi:hypothetical protein
MSTGKDTGNTAGPPVGSGGGLRDPDANRKIVLPKQIQYPVEALSVEDRIQMFRMKFRAVLAVLLMGGAGWFLYKACFTAKESLNENTGLVVGFVTGTVVASIVAFYFGTSESQQNKQPPNGPSGGG